MKYKTIDTQSYTELMFKENVAAALEAKERLMRALVSIDMIARVSPDAAHTIYECTCDLFGCLPEMIEHFKEKGAKK